MLTELEKKVIAAIQGDIPITERPYLEMAGNMDISEEDFLDVLKRLDAKGIIRRFGATLRHQRSGFKANAMVAWQAPPHRIEEAGRRMAAFREVSHCYHRIPAKGWPYNLYTMVHAEDEASCIEIARRLAQQTDIKDYALLFSREELKKTSMEYFPSDDDD